MSEPNIFEMDAEDTKPQDAASTELSSVVAERGRLIEEKAELQDLLQRRQAEFDNFRRRTEREKADFAQYASTELIRELLPIVDDFERALKSDPAGKDYAKGVQMIYSRMTDTLKKVGLEPIDTAGKVFDPHIHQAVEKVQTADAEDNAVLGEFQKGYFFKGKLLRPSMVKVAVQP
jgi:molecular chaperone GrpE